MNVFRIADLLSLIHTVYVERLDIASFALEYGARSAVCAKPLLVAPTTLWLQKHPWPYCNSKVLRAKLMLTGCGW